MPPGWEPPGGGTLPGTVPWETPGGSLIGRWWATLAGTFRGRSFFAAVALSDDAMSAVTFHLVTSVVVGIISTTVSLSYFGISGAGGLGPYRRWVGPMYPGAGFTAGLSIASWFVSVMFSALIGFILPWILGGIHHLVLAMLGGVPAEKSYVHTVRAQAYAAAGPLLFVALPLSIPFLGLMTLLLWFCFELKNHIEAYDEMHRCGSGKPVVAFLSPFLCFCCGWFALVAMLGAVFATMWKL